MPEEIGVLKKDSNLHRNDRCLKNGMTAIVSVKHPRTQDLKNRPKERNWIVRCSQSSWREIMGEELVLYFDKSKIL